MERGTPFEDGEIYHLYTRGVEKRTVFLDKNDYERFVALLFACNNTESVRISNLSRREQGEPLLKMLLEQHPHRDILVQIFAYALMPNHLHLVVQAKKGGDVSRFMLKTMTAYSMYFNTKYQRSGPLFTRPFRSRHVNDDAYFRWLFAYIHLNPLELVEPTWKERGLSNVDRASIYMRTYPYSSYIDYFLGERIESQILSKEVLPDDVATLRNVDDLLLAFSEHPLSNRCYN